MALITEIRATRRPYSAKGIFVATATDDGRYTVQSWPRKRGKAKSTYLKSIQDRMKLVIDWAKRQHPRELTYLHDALDTYNRENGAQMGIATIRFRDLQYALLSGRLIAVTDESGRKYYTGAQYDDISDTFDWLEPEVGSIVVRNTDGWFNTLGAPVGAVLTMGATLPQFPGAAGIGMARPGHVV